MWIIDKLIGKPLATSQSDGQKISAWSGLPILGLDGLSSAAYGPEAALATLLPLGALGLHYIGPVTLVIIALLAILYLSYRQTISAYPDGGGSYTVAKENLGHNAGLLAAAALMIDYILNVAVGISAGIGALISAVPLLHPYTLALCLFTLALITIINLRGVRDTGIAFAAPTYMFIATLIAVICTGLFKAIASGGHPVPVIMPPDLQAPTMQAASLWILLRAFASGCTAMTGVEAVSNATGAFIEPRIDNAKRTLTYIVAILGILLLGISYLANLYHIGAMDQNQPGYQTILSQLTESIAGRGLFYYTTLTSIITVLCLSANTSFADFPRLARMLAEDGYLPNSFSIRGRRLVYTTGILFLSGTAAVLLLAFHGITDALIPLFAVGAFLAFTLSQAGMVMHWRKKKNKPSGAALLINSVGALCTSSAIIIMLVEKFAEGAWVTVLLIPSLLALFKFIRNHYDYVAKQTECQTPINLSYTQPPITIVPIDRWSMLSEHALRFALSLSPVIKAVHVKIDEEKLGKFKNSWQKYVTSPMGSANLPEPELVILTSPYRFFRQPFMDYILKLEKENPDRTIAIVVPELVQSKWYQYLLHNQRATSLKELLLREGNRRVVVINVPWYLTVTNNIEKVVSYG